MINFLIKTGSENYEKNKMDMDIRCNFMCWLWKSSRKRTCTDIYAKSDINRTAVCGTNCSTGGGNTGGGKKKCNDTGTLI